MQVSAEGRALIERFEGLKLKAYRCPAGVWTIGYGHTSAAGSPVVNSGLVISQADADTILTLDLRSVERVVAEAITADMRQSEFDACCSLAFNVGGPQFAHSTVVKRFNAEDYAGAASAFLMWTHAAGRIMPGLVARRAAEVALFHEDMPIAKSLASAVGNDMPQRVDMAPVQMAT